MLVEGAGRINKYEMRGYARLCKQLNQNASATPEKKCKWKRAKWSTNVHGLVAILLHEFHEGFLVNQAGIFPVLSNAEVTKTELGETLVDQIDRGMDIKSNRSL